MLYSLSRFRFSKPQPPFELGGEYVGRTQQHFLGDALGCVRLLGEDSLFAGFADGDLIVVEVLAVEDGLVRVGGARIEQRSQVPAPLRPRPHAQAFTAFVNQVRQFFVKRGLHEVFTPSLVPCPGLEPSLEPFQTEAHFGRFKKTLYLPTSPEIHLKKAMTAGWLDIFEIKPCFRRGEFSTHHENEFLMLEWYRGFADLEMIEADLRALLATLSAPPLTVTDFASLFARFLDFRLTPETGVAELRALCERLDVFHQAEDSYNDLFHRVWIDRIEPELPALGPLLVKRFPPSQAALAKLDPDGWADRFEFYWNGLEIANAFNEVNSADEQLQRWSVEQGERARLGTSPVPQDPGLIEALRRGMPSSGGIALGVERLYMAWTEVDDIRELRLFSIADVFQSDR
jgi:lysyl-tRNA synthetase class 2